MTREQAEQVVKEAIAQGWAEEANSNRIKSYGEGSIDLYDWDQINEERKKIGNEPWPGAKGCSVELVFPGMFSSDKYWISNTEDWRVLKAKVDELKQIISEVYERKWRIARNYPRKAGKLGMYIELVPPGGSMVYPVRVGGMRTWRKLCREYDNIIEQKERPKELKQ